MLDAVVPRVWPSAPVADGLLAIVAELERLEAERIRVASERMDHAD